MALVEFIEELEEEEHTEAGGGRRDSAGPPAPIALPYRPLSKKALKKIARRRAEAIRAYIGPFGSGKTALAVMDSLPTLMGTPWACEEPDHLHTQAGVTSGLRRVLATCRLLDPVTGEDHPLFEQLTEWRQVLDAEHCDLIFDEVTGIAGSRESMGLPVAVQTILQQLRRRDVHLSWTAPNWQRADSIIRGGTAVITDCRGWMPDKKLLRGDAPPAWLPRRLFKARTFNAKDFDEWTAAKASQNPAVKTHALNPMIVQWWWGPGSMVFKSYNSYGAVSRIGSVLDGGRCADCGGRRETPRCKC